MNEIGLVVPANGQETPSLAKRVLEVGQRLRDGTVVLSVDLDKDEALFVPAKIFGGRAKFDYQDDVVRSVNNDALHGHGDWRRITDAEGKTLADNWAKLQRKTLNGFGSPRPASITMGVCAAVAIRTGAFQSGACCPQRSCPELRHLII